MYRWTNGLSTMRCAFLGWRILGDLRYERRVGVVPACGAGILGVPSRQCPCAWLSRRRRLNRFVHRPWCNPGSRISRSINVRYREPRMGEFDPPETLRTGSPFFVISIPLLLGSREVGCAWLSSRIVPSAR